MGPILPLRGQDFRAELFSGNRFEALSLRAGQDPLHLCSTGEPKACMRLKPSAAARCSAEKASIRCSSADETRRFGRISAYSTSPFQLEASPAKSKPARAARAAALRAVELRLVDHALRITAVLDLESYLTGVVAGEAGTLKSPSALEAIAVIARTWALGWRGRHKSEGFDFCSLTHCQVFRFPSDDSSEWPPAFVAAVAKTKGRVLKFGGQLVDPYFSANCGGATEAAAEVWPDRAKPYLVSVVDPYCQGTEHSSWQRTLSLETVRAVLRQDLGVPQGGPVRALTIQARDASGRVRILRAWFDREVEIDANQFRYALNRRLGWNTLKSNLYSFERRGDRLVFTGRGLGHGVGLCQAGAEQMGRMGFDYERILTTYFPGTVVAPLAAEDADPIISSEHFELVFPSNQQPWAGRVLEALESFHHRLGSRATALPTRVRVQTWDTTEQFILATGQPGWAAATNDGQAIALQPLRTLNHKGILESTLRHELTHLVIHRLRAREVPQWFEEGMVLYLTGEQVTGHHGSAFSARGLEEMITKPRSEAEMKAAYALAGEKVRRIARQRGETALWQMLERPTPEDLRWLKKLS